MKETKSATKLRENGIFPYSRKPSNMDNKKQKEKLLKMLRRK